VCVGGGGARGLVLEVGLSFLSVGGLNFEGRTMISSRELGFLFARQGEPEIPRVNLYPKC